jgi:hypothetical protein
MWLKNLFSAIEMDNIMVSAIVYVSLFWVSMWSRTLRTTGIVA